MALPVPTNILLLLSGILIQAKATPREVNGIVGGHALLPAWVPSDQPVLEVRWKFGANKVRLGDSYSTKFVPFNLNLTKYSELKKRVEMYNETTLMITDLKKNDSGVYKAYVQLSRGATEDIEFLVKVYDPVPDPVIEESMVLTPDGCNVTLNCQVPPGIEVHVAWCTRDPNDVTGYQLISDGPKLHLPSHSNQTDSAFHCVVSNPVDKKSTFISLKCPEAVILGKPRKYRLHVNAASWVFSMIVIACVYLWNKRNPTTDSDVTDAGGSTTSEVIGTV